MTTVAVVVATFSDNPEAKAFWNKLAIRAVGSVVNQTVKPHEIKRVHVDQPNALHIARNRAVQMCSSDWIIVLDADDTLHPSYIEEMLAGEGDVRIPSVERFFWDGTHEPPKVIPPARTLLDYSHIHIGAMLRRELFLKVGGFDWHLTDDVNLSCWEDWHFWIKCWLEGASMLSCKKAIYQVHVRPDSRSRQKGNIGLGSQIRLKMEPIARAKGLLDEAHMQHAKELKKRFGIGQ